MIGSQYRIMSAATSARFGPSFSSKAKSSTNRMVNLPPSIFYEGFACIVAVDMDPNPALHDGFKS